MLIGEREPVTSFPAHLPHSFIKKQWAGEEYSGGRSRVISLYSPALEQFSLKERNELSLEVIQG